MVDSSSYSSRDEDDEVSSGEIGDVALFMRKYKKGLKREGYKFVKRRFPNKQKRKCYNCGSTEHFIADCPYENKEDKKDKKKHYKKMTRPNTRRTIRVKLILVMNGIQMMIAQVKKK